MILGLDCMLDSFTCGTFKKALEAEVSQKRLTALVWSGAQASEFFETDHRILMDSAIRPYEALARYYLQKPSVSAKPNRVEKHKAYCQPHLSITLSSTPYKRRGLDRAVR